MSPLPDAILLKLVKVEEIPTLPQVIGRILDLSENEYAGAQDLTALLEMDHAISARLLRLANSAFFGFGQRIDSIRRAVVAMGFDTVRQLALASSAVEALSRKSLEGLDVEDFWLHAFGSAKTAQLLAEMRQMGKEGEAVFTAALLHDVGKYVLALSLGEGYGKILMEARQADRPLHEVEEEVLGADHAVTGGWLLQYWKFPGLFPEVVRCFYTPHLAEIYQEETHLVRLAHYVTCRAGLGTGGEICPEKPPRESLDALRLDRHDLESLIARVAEMRGEALAFLEALD